MPQFVYLIIAIVVIVALVAIFVISFIAYRRTPVPKGCEDLVANKEKCEGCLMSECPLAHGREEGH
ncbi:MAG: hypothetical protein K5694_04760 [Bacilli bacterium]|nr:hypothetical protein [Bacilli bacterium]